ncbi:hypothetical protein HYW58_03065 [Candidatus Kaiserbacteria bacterium]|nr:hypothetical protein [Candidatus Kaiserbacteria bacterium]
MKRISDFFSKFSAIQPTGRSVVRACVEVLRRRNIPINEDELMYSRNTVYVKSHQVVKNEIFLSKEIVIKEINQKLGDTIVKDVR